MFPDAANSDNMSENVDMVEVRTDSNKSDELFSVCKNINMVDNHSRKDETTSTRMHHSSIHIKISFQ